MSDFNPFEIEEQDAATEAQKAEAAQQLRYEISDLQWLMGNKRGRRIVWRLLEQAGVHHSTFHENARVAAFKEGQRNQGLRLLSLVLGHCRESYVAMLQERI